MTYEEILASKHIRAVSHMRRPNHSDPVDEEKMLQAFEQSVEGWVELSSRAIARIEEPKD